MNFSQVPFFSESNDPIEYGYSDEFGSGTTTVFITSATFTPVSDDPYDIAVSDAHWTEDGLFYRLDIVGPAQPSPTHSTPISFAKVYWAEGDTPGDTIGQPLDSQNIYWNQSGANANISNLDLPAPPSNATHLVVVAESIAAEGSRTGNNHFALPLFDVAITSLEWTPDDTVQFTYEVRSNPLDQPVTLDVFLDFGDETGESLWGVFSGLSETTVGTHGPITLPRESLFDASFGARRIVAIADVEDLLAERSEANNRRTLNVPDLSINLLNWRDDFDGVDLAWSIEGHALPRGTSVALYWSIDGTEEGAVGEALFTQSIAAGATAGSQVHVSDAALGTPPVGANQLVAIVDPRADEPPVGLIVESNEENNVALLLPDIRIARLDWTASGDGVEIEYDVLGILPAGTTLLWYWAGGAGFINRFEPPVFSQVIPSQDGHYGPISATFATLGLPPVGATHLVAVADLSDAEPAGVITEQDEQNNELSLQLPDLVISSASWNGTDGGLDFQFAANGNDLPLSTNVAVYWADGDTFDDSIGAAIAIFPTGKAEGTSATIHLTPAQLGTRPTQADRLLIVVDPLDGVGVPGLVPESNEDNNLRSLKPDLELRSPAWQVSAEAVTGIGFEFFIGGFLTADTQVEAWWATGPAFADRIGSPLVSVPTGTAAGVFVAPTISAAQIAARPAEATHLVVSGDLPGNVNLEESETNNENRLALPDLSATSGEWIVGENSLSVRIEYLVAFGPAPIASSVQLFWANGNALANAMGGPIATPALATEVGTHELLVEVGLPPSGATHLLAVFDPLPDGVGIVPETNEANNLFVLFDNRAPVIAIDPALEIDPVEANEEVVVSIGTLPFAMDPDGVIDVDIDPLAVPDTGIAVEAVQAEPDPEVGGTGTVAISFGLRAFAGGPITWEPIGPVSPNQALLLSPDMFLRFSASPDAAGRIKDVIRFRAWDQTSGTPGGFADTTINGGATAFSATTVGLDLQMLPTTIEITGIDVSPFTLFNGTGPSPEQSLTQIRVNTNLDGLGLDLHYEFDFDNNGVFEVSTNTKVTSHDFGNQGDYTFGVRVSTALGAQDTSSAQASVENLAPDLEIEGLFLGYVGVDLPFKFRPFDSFFDFVAGSTYQIDWNGDGTVDQIVTAPFDVELNHQFPSAGTFEVHATVTDNDGAISPIATFEIEIRDLPPPPTGDIVDVSPDPREDAVAEIRVEFDQPVGVLTVDSFVLTRNGQTVSLAGATLSTDDLQNYVLSGLAGKTTQPGTYELRLPADEVFIAAGLTLATDLTETWVVSGAATEIDLVVSQTESASTIVAGSSVGNLSYVITVTNSGVSDASGVVVHENLTLPPGVSLVSIVPSSGTSFAHSASPDGNWTIGNLASGASATLTIVVTVDASVVTGVDVITSTATVTAANETLVNVANDTQTTSTSVTRQVDLVVSQSESIPTVVAGSSVGNLSYVITVTNSGPSDASGVVVHENLTLPPGVSLVSIVASSGTSFAHSTSPDGNWTIGNLASGASATLTVLVTVGASAVTGVDVISSTATVTAANETRVNVANDTQTTSTSVTRQVDLVVSQLESVPTVVAGSSVGNLSYVITVTNSGPSDASGVVVHENLTLPPGVSLVSIVPGSGTSFAHSASPDGNWTIGNLASGASATLTVLVSVGASTAAGVDLIGSVATVTAANETRLNVANDTQTTSTSVTRQVDLVVSQTESVPTVVAGSSVGNLSYVITVTNSGPSDASGVVVHENLTLPPGVSLVSIVASSGTSFSHSTSPDGNWTIGNLASGASATLTVLVSVGASTAAGVDVISSVATVTAANETLVNVANDTQTTSTSVTRQVDLVVSQSGSAPTIEVGVGAGQLTYTVTVSNSGPSDASGVVLSEDLSLPSGVTLLSVTPSVGTSFAHTTSLDGNWTVGDLASGASATLTIVLIVGPTTVTGVDVIGSTATVIAANETRVNIGNDTQTTSTSVGEVRNKVVFDALSGMLIVGGTSGKDTIVVAPVGSGATAKLQVTVNKKVLSNTILLASIQQIHILGLEESDVITVSNLAIPLTVEGGAGADTITLTGHSGTVNVDGGTEADSLIVNGLKGANNTFELSVALLTVNGKANTLSNLENLTINGQTKVDTLTVLAPPGVSTIFNGGAGIDLLQGPDAASTWAITALGAGTLKDALNNTLVSFKTVETITGGSAEDTFDLSSGKSFGGKLDGGEGTGDTITYAGHTGAATVNLQSKFASLTKSFLNVESFIGTSGTAKDTLIGTDADNQWNITGANAGTVGAVTFAGFENLTGGKLADTFHVADGASVSGKLNGGLASGINVLNYSGNTVASTVNLQTKVATGIASFLNIQKIVGAGLATTLVGPSGASTWNITANNAGQVGITKFEQVGNLRGGTANDTFILADGMGLSGLLDGGGGKANVLNYAAYTTPVTVDLTLLTATNTGSIANLASFVGGAGEGDTLVGPNLSNIWTLPTTKPGKLNTIPFSSFENLTGGAQSDAFDFAKGLGITGQIDGGGGRNRLNYSAYTTSVIVDLTAGTATNTGGIANIQDVTGGSAGDTLTGNALDNVLLGNGGNDTLAGLAGRDLLFGGLGGDTLHGGEGEDLLIGGTTTLDSKSATINDLAAFWSRLDLDFATRGAQLAAGTTNVPSLLKIKFKLDSKTAKPDAFIDTLTGGSESDWFFAKTIVPNLDVLVDQLLEDRLN